VFPGRGTRHRPRILWLCTQPPRCRHVSSLRRASDASVPLDSSDVVSIRHVLLHFHAPRGLPVTPSGLLGSLSPNLLTFTLHLPWFIGTNLSFDLHHIRRPPRRILRLHITSQETSNSHHVVNHLSSSIDHLRLKWVETALLNLS